MKGTRCNFEKPKLTISGDREADACSTINTAHGLADAVPQPAEYKHGVPRIARLTRQPRVALHITRLGPDGAECCAARGCERERGDDGHRDRDEA